MPNLTTIVICLLHWLVDNWNVQRAEISNLSENNLVTALSVGRMTLLELVMSRSHQSSWKILFDGSTRIKPVYGTLNSRNFWYSTVFFSYPPNWTKLDLTFILNNYQRWILIFPTSRLPPWWAICRWGILISRYINIAHLG